MRIIKVTRYIWIAKGKINIYNLKKILGQEIRTLNYKDIVAVITEDLDIDDYRALDLDGVLIIDARGLERNTYINIGICVEVEGYVSAYSISNRLGDMVYGLEPKAIWAREGKVCLGDKAQLLKNGEVKL